MKLLALLLLVSVILNFVGAKKTYIIETEDDGHWGKDIETEDDGDNDGEDFTAGDAKWKSGKKWKSGNKWKGKGEDFTAGDAKWKSGNKWKGKGEDFAALPPSEVKKPEKGNNNKWEKKNGTTWKSGDDWKGDKKWTGKGGAKSTENLRSREIDSKETEKDTI